MPRLRAVAQLDWSDDRHRFGGPSETGENANMENSKVSLCMRASTVESI